MARNDDVYTALRSASPAELVAFCAGCAERASGVFRLLNGEAENDWFRSALDLGWQAAAGSEVDDEATEVLEEAMADLDEEEEDDPNSQEFYSSQVAMLAVNTLSVYLNPVAQQAEMSGQTVETLYSDFDLTLSGDQAVVTRYGQPPAPPGELQRLEQEAQAEFVGDFVDGTGAAVTPQSMQELREAQTALRDQILRRVQAVADARGWDVSA